MKRARKLALLVGVVTCGAAVAAIAQPPGPPARADLPDSRSVAPEGDGVPRGNADARGEPEVPQSFAIWAIRCLGLFGLLALLTGGAVFIGAVVVVFSTRRPAVIASYLVFLLFPPLLGVIGALKAFVAAFSVLAFQPHMAVRQSEICGVVAEALVLPVSALTVTLPSFLVVAIGLFVRTLQTGGQPTTRDRETERRQT